MKRALTCVGLLALASCHHEEHHHKEKAKFLVTKPLRRDVMTTKDYVCQIKSIRHIEVRALEKGYLQRIFVDEGQVVKKGQRLYQILPALYRAEYAKAEAEAQFAQIEYQNTKKLADHKVVSPNELALAAAKRAKARAAMKLAKVHLKFTEIRAPFAGIVGRLRVRRGSLVGESELLTTLSDNSKMWVYFNVSEADYLDYKQRQRAQGHAEVRLQMANDKVFDHKGAISTIEADFNNETGNIAFRATFPNPKRLLRHGQTGRVLMDIPVKNALLIPQKTTFELLTKKYVFVVDEKNAVRQRQVFVADEELPHIYIVEKGLREGEKILLEGLRRVENGEHIEPVYKHPKEVLAHLDIPAG